MVSNGFERYEIRVVVKNGLYCAETRKLPEDENKPCKGIIFPSCSTQTSSEIYIMNKSALKLQVQLSKD